MQTVKEKIVARIYSRGRGCSFSKIDFVPPFSDIEVRKALSDLAKEGTIWRLQLILYSFMNLNTSQLENLVIKAVSRNFQKITVLCNILTCHALHLEGKESRVMDDRT